MQEAVLLVMYIPAAEQCWSCLGLERHGGKCPQQYEAEASLKIHGHQEHEWPEFASLLQCHQTMKTYCVHGHQEHEWPWRSKKNI